MAVSPPKAVPARRRGRRSTPSTFSTANIFGLSPERGDDGFNDMGGGGGLSDAADSIASSSITLNQDRPRGGRRGGSLPNVPGVSGLLKSEAKRDMRQMEGMSSSAPPLKRSMYENWLVEPSVRVANLPPVPLESLLGVKRRRLTRWGMFPDEIVPDMKKQAVMTALSRKALERAESQENVSRRGHILQRQRILSRRRAADAAVYVYDEVLENLEKAITDEVKLGPRMVRREDLKDGCFDIAVDTLRAWAAELEGLLRTRSELIASLGEEGAEEIDECAAIEPDEKLTAAARTGFHADYEGDPLESPHTILERGAGAGPGTREGVMEVADAKRSSGSRVSSSSISCGGDDAETAAAVGDVYVTPMGTGEVLEVREKDGVLVINLLYGVGYFSKHSKGTCKHSDSPPSPPQFLPPILRSSFGGQPFLEELDMVKRWKLLMASPDKLEHAFWYVFQRMGFETGINALDQWKKERPGDAEWDGSLMSTTARDVYDALGAPSVLLSQLESALPSHGGPQMLPGLGHLHWEVGVLEAVRGSTGAKETKAVWDECFQMVREVEECKRAHQKAQDILAQSVEKMAERRAELALLRAAVEECRADMNLPVTTRGSLER